MLNSLIWGIAEFDHFTDFFFNHELALEDIPPKYDTYGDDMDMDAEVKKNMLKMILQGNTNQ